MKVQNTMRNRKTRGVLLVALCVITVLQVRRQWQSEQWQHETPKVRVIDPANPPAEFTEFNSYGKILGNPQNAISDLRGIHKACLIYRKKFKRYPTSVDLLGDMQAHLVDYGLANGSQAISLLTNPDVVHSADPRSRDARNTRHILCYEFAERRFDNQPLGSPKRPGTRDVLASTNLYYFPNNHVEWAHLESSTMNPVGFYIVLWDDGQVENIPFDKVLNVPTGKDQWGLGFPGQAGLPKGVKTFDQFNADNPAYQKWKQARAKKTKASTRSRTP